MSGTLNTGNAAPVDADEFARLLEFIAPPLAPKLAVAVSGGPDSMALVFCLKRWAQRAIVAFIVDHRLRAESSAEAANVKTFLAQSGIDAEVLSWEHEPVTGRLHEKARAARYRLLIEACRRHGARDLFIAHHRDDQAETILMRLAKGSGVDGLAGMKAQKMRDGIRFLRPFLSLPKDRLIATCQKASLPFITDKSNKNEKFARGRLRKILPLLAEEGLTVESLLTLGARAAEAKNALEHYTNDFLRRAAKTGIGGNVELDRALLRMVPRAVGLRALTVCLRYIHTAEYPPEYATLSSLYDALILTADTSTRTLYGCIASLSSNRVVFLREPSATETQPFQPGKSVSWDGRWLVTAKEYHPAQSLTLRALGTPPHAVLDRLSPALRSQIPQGRVRAGLPALWLGEQIHAIPSFDEKSPLSISYLKQLFP